MPLVESIARGLAMRSMGAYATPPNSGGSWSWPMIRESSPGAWQRGVVLRPETVLSYQPVYSCVTLVSSDVGKLRMQLKEQDKNGIWNETSSASFSPVLDQPNNYQNSIQFLQHWVTSKLTHGNTYLLKERDSRGIVTDLHVLDPLRCKPLVAPDGSVYYQLGADWLAGLEDAIVAAPASEIIHDRMNPLFHPLVGVSPIYASGLAAVQGLDIQRNSTAFFRNGARPGGVLTAPGRINDETAKRLKEYWQERYTGENAGNVAVLGDGLTYEAMVMTAVDAQLIDQLKMSAEMVCSAYHVPPYLVGLSDLPARVSIEALAQQYYSQCLQILISSIQRCLKDGLKLPAKYEARLNLDDLLMMDTAAQYKTYGDGIQAGLLTPNGGRKKINEPPVPGGDQVYLQQQNFSLEALAKRDATADPFGAGKSPAPAPDPAPAADPAKAGDGKAASIVNGDAQRLRLANGLRKSAA